MPWQLYRQLRLESQHQVAWLQVVLLEVHGLAGMQAPAVVFGRKLDTVLGSRLAT